MAAIKAFSDLQQSRKLAEILPLESADMHYEDCEDGFKIHCEPSPFGYEYNIPCWSLAALLGVLPFPVLYMKMVAGMILWCCECHFIETDEMFKIEHYDNPVDACYELILKLNELKML